MKNKISEFLKTNAKAKWTVIVSISLILIIGIAVLVYVFGIQKTVNAATNNETENNTEEIDSLSAIEDSLEEMQEEPEIEEEEQEEPKPEEKKKVTYKEKTVVIPESTVAPVNSVEDAEKDKKTGGEEVSQEEVETMFENIGKKSMGIDVSAHQGVINWAKVKESGVEFAMIRVGFRGYTEGKIYEDKYFKSNINGAIANGIRVGIYFYSAAINETEALEEAAWVVNKIAPYNITYPVVYDFEDFNRNRCINVSGKEATENALLFLNYVKSSGYEPMMYANKNDITNKMSRNSFSCKFWLAHYTEQTDYKGSFNMWQYTSKGSVPGISGNVDMDIAYFTYGKIAEPKHTHDFNTLVGKEKPASCMEDGNRTFRCSCGETETKVIKMLGHSYGDWKIEAAPTTEKEGVEKRICSNCNKEETRKIDKLVEENEKEPEVCNHEYKTINKEDATCINAGYELKECTKCKEQKRIEIKAKGHTAGEWIIDKEATETEEGSKHKECIVCNETIETQKIEKTEKVEEKEITEDRIEEKAISI